MPTRLNVSYSFSEQKLIFLKLPKSEFSKIQKKFEQLNLSPALGICRMRTEALGMRRLYCSKYCKMLDIDEKKFTLEGTIQSQPPQTLINSMNDAVIK